MTTDPVPIPRLPPQESYPLSAFQRGLWSLVQANAGNPFYNASRILKLAGPLDLGRFHRALEIVVARHDVLRASFAETESGPVQRITAAVEIGLPLEDLSALPAPRREARLRQWIRETAWSPFDLEKAPLMRCRVFRFAVEDHRLVITAHHLISDGGSGRLMMEELALLYQAPGVGSSPLPPAVLQYQDFCHWQNERMAAGAMAGSEAYWLRRLGGELPVVELPADRRRPPVPSYRGAQHRRLLSAALTARLKELRRKQGTTIFRVMLAAFDTLLVRLGGETEVIVGSPVSGRTHPALRDVQGLFVTMLALRLDLGGDPPFTEVLARVKESTREDIERRDFPFDTLVQLLNPSRDPGRPPIFNVVLTMREATFASELRAGELVMSQDEVPMTLVSRYDLTLIVAETPAGLRLTFEYSTDLFDPGSIIRLAGNLERLLEGAAAAPGERISRLPLLAEAERAAVLLEWNDTGCAVAGEALVHRRFERQAAVGPDRTAVVAAGRRLTYRQLDEQANRLARHLQGLGVGPDAAVGLLLERSPELLVAVLAVLKAGGAYVPLTPDDPPQRLAFIAADSRMARVVTRSEHARSLGDLPAVLLDRDAEEIGRLGAGAPAGGATPASLAYVLYTSGSTGVPKGVMVPHDGVVNYLAWCREAYGLEPGRRSLLHSSIAFDLTVTALLGPLLTGGEVHLVDEAAGVPGIAEALRQGPVQMLKLTPAHLAVLAHELTPELAARVSVLVVGGDAVTGEALDLFRAASPATRVVNEYGPTEATVGCAVHGRPAGAIGDGPVPIGRPIANARLYVLSREMEPLPPGARGELFIGGDGLARGYLGRPDLTAERFVPDPFGGSSGARLYRSGDVVRRSPEGALEYLGRNDHQVKILGVRVEPEETAAMLVRHPAVREAVVLARETSPGDRQLVAYLVPSQKPGLAAGELRDFLAARLPAAMVPARFVEVEALPLTPRGKVDRGALAALGAPAGRRGATYVPPRDAVEWELAGLWEKTLGIQGIGVLDNFFALGGHSLLAVALVGKVQRRFGAMIPVAALVQAPTIAGMSLLVKAGGVPGGPVRLAANLVPMRHGDLLQPPLLLVHAHLGGVFSYHALAKALDDGYPIYGLQAPGLEEGEEPLDSVTALATLYVDQVRALWPAGPYKLLGWSFGGLVAYEMARQLEKGGGKVEILALLDCNAPEDLAPEPAAADTLDGIGRAFFKLDDGTLAGLDESQALQLLLARGRDLSLLPEGMTAESLGRLVRVLGAHTRAIAGYRPTDGIQADICLLLAAAGSQVRDPAAWRGRTLGTCSVVEVPGSHHEMVFPPAVEEMAAVLSRALSGWREGRSPSGPHSDLSAASGSSFAAERAGR